jgi:hypothetical protein
VLLVTSAKALSPSNARVAASAFWAGSCPTAVVGYSLSSTVFLSMSAAGISVATLKCARLLSQTALKCH